MAPELFPERRGVVVGELVGAEDGHDVLGAEALPLAGLSGSLEGAAAGFELAVKVVAVAEELEDAVGGGAGVGGEAVEGEEDDARGGAVLGGVLVEELVAPEEEGGGGCHYWWSIGDGGIQGAGGRKRGAAGRDRTDTRVWSKLALRGAGAEEDRGVTRV